MEGRWWNDKTAGAQGRGQGWGQGLVGVEGEWTVLPATRDVLVRVGAGLG